MAAQEAWPPLSTTQPYDNVMIGQAERPHAEQGGLWEPVGIVTKGDDVNLNPLVATVRSTGSGTPVLTQAQIDALLPGDSNRGESPLIGAVNLFRGLVKRSRPQTEFGRVLAMNCGVAGKSVEEWQQGHAEEIFNKLPAAATLAASVAAGENLQLGLAAVPVGSRLFELREHLGRRLQGVVQGVG